jgi:S-layer protein
MSGSLTTDQAITQDYQNILQRTPDAAGLANWAAAVDSGALTLLQVDNAIVASPEAQDSVVPIVEMYTALGRAPDAAGLSTWVAAFEGGESLTSIADAFLSSPEGVGIYGTGAGIGAPDANTAFITTVYQEVLGRLPDSAGQAAWTSALDNGTLTPAEVLVDILQSPEATQRDATPVTNFLVAAGQGTADYGGSLFSQAGTTFTLTPGVDNIALTGNNNVVNGTANGSALTTPATFNTGDTITAAAGSTGNVLNLSDINEPFLGSDSGFFDPTDLAGVTVSGIQTLNLNSTEGVVANTASSIEGFTGLTALNVNDAGFTQVTAASTTDVAVTDSLDPVTESTGSVQVLGGDNITISSVDGATVGGGTTATDPAGSVTVTDASSTGITINGGTTISATETDGSAITIGAVAAPTDTVTVTDSSAPTTSSTTLGPIDVTGGTVVNVTENELGAVDGTVTGGNVNVTGTAATTSVSVTQTAAAAQSPTVTGVADGAVTINDTASTITSVSLDNYGASTITDDALANLTLAGTGSGVTIVDPVATPTTTLNLTVDGLTDTAGIVDTFGEITTLNVVTGGATPSTLGFADTGLTTLNVSGTQGLAFGDDAPLAGLSAVNVSGGAGLSIALGGNTTFTSTSTGTDVVTISESATKPITGNGTADEELVWNGAAAPATSADLGNASGFSVLGIGPDVASGTFDMSKITGFSGFDVEGDNTTTNTIELTNVAAGSPLAIDGEFDGTLVYQTADSAGATDSLAVTLGAAANTAGFLVGGLTAEDSNGVGIGNLTITSNASGTNGLVAVPGGGGFNEISNLKDSSLSTLNVAGTGGLFIASMLDTDATSLTINGNSTGTAPITFTGVTDATLAALMVTGSDAVTLGGLTDSAASLTLTNSGSSTLGVGVLADPNLASLTLSGNVAVDLKGDKVATGVTVNGAMDNSAVAVDMHASGAASGETDSFTLGNGTDSVQDLSTAGATVNIKVGNGGDSTTANTIAVGDANSTITAGSGVNNITVGNGTNTITVGDGNDAITTGNGTNTITAGSGNDSITVGSGLNTITVGAGTDTLSFFNPGANGLTFSTVSGAQAGDTLTFSEGPSSAPGIPLAGSSLAEVSTLAGTASFSDYLNAAAAAGTTAGDMSWFQFNNNTYLVENVAGGSSFSGGTDYVVGLSGLHNLGSNSTLTQIASLGGTDSSTLTLGSHFA